MQALDLHPIHIDGGTQPRATIDPAMVDEYAEAMERLTRFPPLVVYFDGENAWLADGFHPDHAAQKAVAAVKVSSSMTASSTHPTSGRTVGELTFTMVLDCAVRKRIGVCRTAPGHEPPHRDGAVVQTSR